MADGLTTQETTLATVPTGSKIATDDAGAAGHVQIIKLAIAADGSATVLPGDATDGLLVNLGANNDVVVSDGGNVISVDDAAGSLTVDGTVGVSGTVTVDGSGVTQPVSNAGLTELAAAIDTEVQVDVVGALPAGDNNIGNVDVVTMPTTTVQATNLDIRDLDSTTDDVRVGGMAAHDVAVADNPVTIGGRSNDAVPTEVSADGEAVWAWMLRNGAQMVASAPHLGMIADPYTLLNEVVQQTTAQTGTDILTVNSGKRLVITSLQIQVGGTTAGTVQVWFGATADTTYSRGTDRALFDGEFAPSATLKPGVFVAPPTPWIGGVDEELHLTTSADVTITVNVWYYEV